MYPSTPAMVGNPGGSLDDTQDQSLHGMLDILIFQEELPDHVK
jgi:hypothetical protein